MNPNSLATHQFISIHHKVQSSGSESEVRDDMQSPSSLGLLHFMSTVKVEDN